MSAKDEGAAKKAALGMIAGVIVVETVLVATAVFGAGIYWNDPAFRTGGVFQDEVTETILLEVARHQLPTAAGMMLLAGGLAIIFSTATTFLIVPSTNLTRDLYQRFWKPGAEQRSVIGFQRWMILALAVVSLLITDLFPSILAMALYAYTMVGAAVTPALLAAFLWRRVTPKAGTFSVAAGIVATLAFGILNQLGMSELHLGLFTLPLDYRYIIYPAGAASILSLVVVSYLTPPSSEEQWRPFWPDAR
jgi:SSS family solute:Na+ symporter/sodium/proline symporter